MAVQDFGSGLLSGIQGAMAFNQQRRKNEFTRRELDQRDRQLGLSEDELKLGKDRLAENSRQFNESLKRTDRELAQGDKRIGISQQQVDIASGELALLQSAEERAATKFKQEQSTELSGQLFNRAGKLGYVSKDNAQELDTTALAVGLAEGNSATDSFALDILNNGRLPRPEGFSYTAINRDPRTGLISVVGRYDNGEPGVLTEQGGSDPNENTLMLTPGQAAKLLSNEWVNFDVIDGAKGNAGAAYQAAMNVNQADIDVGRARASLQANVTAAVDSQNDPAASREFRRILATAETDEERQDIIMSAAEDMGITIPSVMDKTGELIDYTPDMQATYTGEYSMRASEANRATFGARRRRIEGYDSDIAELEASLANASPAQQRAIQDKINQKDAKRGALIRDLNTTSLEAVGREISDLTAKRDKAAAARKPYWQGEIDKKMKVQKDLEESLGMRTPVMGTEAYKNLENQVIARVENMTAEEVDAAVDRGELSFDAESLATMRQRLTEAGVTTIQDVAKLPTREQLATRALLSVIAPDQTARDQARNEMSNLKETGTLSLSAQEAGKQAIDQGTLRARLGELTRNLRKDELDINASEQARVDAASQLSADFIKETNAIFFGEDGTSINLGEDEARQFARRILPQFLQRASTSKSEREARQYQSGLNTGVSLVMASYAAEETGGLGETFYSFFRPDAADSAGGTDFNLRNVEMVTDSNGNPLEFYYLNEEGARTDQPISASDLQKLDKAVYNVVVDAANRNAR